MKSLHFKLFSKYAALILSILILFMVLLYIIWGNTLKANAMNELQADCDNISTLLDTQMDQMNQLSKRIVTSKQLQSLFVQDLYSNQTQAYYNKRLFSDTLFDIIKLSFSNMELNILDTFGRHVYIGSVSTFHFLERDYLSDIEWFQPTLDAYGKPLIIPTHLPELTESSSPIISLCRAFAPSNNKEETAVLELQIQYSFIEQKIQHAIHNQKGQKKIYVYNENGQLIYPYDTPILPETEAYIMNVLKNPNSTDTTAIIETSLKNPIFLSYRTSSLTNWTVFVSSSKEDLLASFYQFQFLILIASCAILILTLFITYQIADKLSIPLRKLEQTARSLTLGNLDSLALSPCKNNFQELDSLYHSFEQMRINLQNSLNDVVAAHTMAVDAKMLALQSQMNPHFLYNTLASISILAEDGENDKISKICDDLSLLLRYIASGSSINVPLSQEIEHTRSYIHLIKVKYEERIQFEMNIDVSILSITVPKLIIQPLVENCIKYALDVPSPWNITIQGYIENNYWIVQIKDNGSGFTTEYLEMFHKKAAQIKSEKVLPDLGINGMGLLNLYTRLFLLYKEQLIFQLENNKDSGACVTIGGPLSEDLGENKNENAKN